MIKLVKPILAYCIPNSKYGCSENTGVAATTNFEKYLTTIIGVLTLVGVLWFTFQVILSGYALISSSGDPKKMEKAQQQLMQSILGIVIVVASSIVVGLIVKILGLGNIFDLNTFIGNLGL
jgi:hypothetical protein